MLISSLFGKKILLITHLLKWYLKHGLNVTKLHKVIQFTPKKCFQKFGNQVFGARRSGNIDSSQKILEDTFKL